MAIASRSLKTYLSHSFLWKMLHILSLRCPLRRKFSLDQRTFNHTNVLGLFAIIEAYVHQVFSSIFLLCQTIANLSFVRQLLTIYLCIRLTLAIINLNTNSAIRGFLQKDFPSFLRTLRKEVILRVS